MPGLQEELSALRALQEDFSNIKYLKEQIEKKKKKIASAEKEIKKDFIIQEPRIDHTESRRMEKEMADLSKQIGGGAVAGLLGCSFGMALIGLFAGYGFGKIWAALGACCVFVFGCFGIIPGVIGCGLATWMGWKAWCSVSPLWQIILVLLAVLALISGHFYSKAEKKETILLAKMQADLEQQKKQEKENWEKAKKRYDKEKKKAEAEMKAISQTQNQALNNEINDLYARLGEVNARIANNAVLDNSDKTAEVVEFLISQIQRKRANSLADALLQYDNMVRQRDKDRFERETRQLQMDMERMWQDQRIRQEADDRFNQAMHNMRVEKEQRRQTELLQELKDSLDN